jgi:hypothetical protein
MTQVCISEMGSRDGNHRTEWYEGSVRVQNHKDLVKKQKGKAIPVTGPEGP